MTVVSLTIHATIKLQPGYTPNDLMDDVEHELRKFGGLDITSIGTSTPPITTELSGVEGGVEPVRIRGAVGTPSEEDHMSEATTEQQQVRVRVEDDTHGIYIGAGAIEAIRSEANGQAHERIKEAVALWDELDVEDLDAIKECEFKFALARAALATLRWLAPIPDDDPVA